MEECMNQRMEKVDRWIMDGWIDEQISNWMKCQIDG